nr:MAG TPA: hypothetical protein [Caudoviricetes sp.]
MTTSVLEMNGEKIAKQLTYLPSNRSWYSIVIKGEKMQNFKTAEECLSYLKSRQDEDIVAYIKIPQQMHTISLDSLRIA